MTGTDLRIRLRSARHPYGRLVWAYEVYDPTGRPGMQVRADGGWFPSWDAARWRALAALDDMTHPYEQTPEADVRVCRCGKWPDHHVHTGDRAACSCDDCHLARCKVDGCPCRALAGVEVP